MSPAPAELPSLRREVLLNLALLTAAALSLAVATALVAQSLAPQIALLALVSLIAADVLIVFLFGRYLINRLVLDPVERLNRAADALAAGKLEQRAPEAETREFTDLAQRLNHMTERLLDMQTQLVRAEKFASIGHLAAGIAHEVGNPLSAIGTYLDVLERRGVGDDLLQPIRREASRIDGIVRGLLAYARPDVELGGTLDPGTVIRAALDLLRQQGKLRDIALDIALDDDLPPVQAKAALLEQVMVNLLLNAADAAPGGPISVGAAAWRYAARAAGERRRSDHSADANPGGAARPTLRPWRPELPDGTPGVLIWVADAGPGVSQDERERVFDPFVTTKEPGRGTGLGLAIVQRVIYGFGGVVWVDDAREGGAAFKVFLPSASSRERP